jgi:hypothetical protein
MYCEIRIALCRMTKIPAVPQSGSPTAWHPSHNPFWEHRPLRVQMFFLFSAIIIFISQYVIVMQNDQLAFTPSLCESPDSIVSSYVPVIWWRILQSVSKLMCYCLREIHSNVLDRHSMIFHFKK